MRLFATSLSTFLPWPPSGHIVKSRIILEVKKNQHYHWPKPDNPMEWNPQTNPIHIPHLQIKKRTNTHQWYENPYSKNKRTPSQSKRLMLQVSNTWSLSCGDTHPTDNLCCVQTQGQMSFRHTLLLWRLSDRLVIHILLHCIDINTIFQKCPQIMPSQSTKSTGQNVKQILGVSKVWVTSRS